MIKQLLFKDAIGKFTNDKINIWRLSPDISVLGDDIIHRSKTRFGLIDEENKIIYIDRRMALESNGKRNPLLSHTALVPNVMYCVMDDLNKHEFYTDNLGRIIKSKHYPKVIYKGRLNDEQTKALMCRDEDTKPNTPKKINDEGGHILADSCGGLPESINIFPQAYCVNHSSEWRGMENRIKAAVEKEADVIVETKFEFRQECKRPYKYKYEVVIDCVSEKYEFLNVNDEF